MATQLEHEPPLLAAHGGPTIIEKTTAAAHEWREGLRRCSLRWPGAFTLNGALSAEQLTEIEDYHLHPKTYTLGYRNQRGQFLAAVACNMTEAADAAYLPANHLYVRFWYRSPNAPRGLGRSALGGVLHMALRDEECDGVVLHVRPDNTEAIGIYRTLGFDRYVHADQLEDMMHLPRERVANALGIIARVPSTRNLTSVVY